MQNIAFANAFLQKARREGVRNCTHPMFHALSVTITTKLSANLVVNTPYLAIQCWRKIALVFHAEMFVF